MPDTDHGTQFEIDFAKRNGLDRVPGSGSQWHSKMDVHGKSVRWSLKSTRFASFQVSRVLFEELAEATGGVGGTGEIPMLAVQLQARTANPPVVVCMLEEDFRRLATEHLELVRESKAEARRRAASTPQLLRDLED